jgi:hypothetical protein
MYRKDGDYPAEDRNYFTMNTIFQVQNKLSIYFESLKSTSVESSQ